MRYTVALSGGWSRANWKGVAAAVEFLIYLVLGGFAGTLAGLFGVGGGMIIVPVLVYSFTAQGFDVNVLTHMAVGSSLATIAFTSINAIRAHHLKGAVRWPLFVWMAVGIVFGTVLGALTAATSMAPAAENHRRVRYLYRYPDGLRYQTQGRHGRAGQARTGSGGGSDRLGLCDLRYRRRLTHSTLSGMAQRAHAAGRGNVVSLWAAHRSGRCDKLHVDGLVRRALA